MWKYKGRTVFLTAVATTLAVYAPASGQEAPGGLTLTFGISSSLRANDNLDLDNPSPGTSTLWDNTLSFGLLKEDQIQSIRLDLEGVVRVSNIPGGSTDVSFLDDSSAGFAYARNLGNSRLEFGADYSNSDLVFIDPLSVIEDLDETDLIDDNGRRELISANLAFETGINDPIGFLLELDRGARRYSGTTDPGLFDTDTSTITATGRFRFSEVLEGRLIAYHNVYDAMDVPRTERTTDTISIGATYDVSPTLTIDASIGHSEVEENLTAIPSTSTEKGVVGTFALTKALANGTAGLSFDKVISITGGRSNFEVSRLLELPQGTLEASIGASRGDAGNTQAIGSIFYNHELPLGNFSATASRRYATSTLGNDTRITSATFGYNTQLSPLSGLAFNVQFSEVVDVGAGAVGHSSIGSFRTTYSYELTNDWNLLAGYERRFRRSDTVPRTYSNEIFLTLEREFTIHR